jgi:small subunit ribosomal protein S13
MGVTKVKDPKKGKEGKKSVVKKKEVVKEKKVKKVIEGVRGIVRVAEVDLDGNKKLRNSILGIKGVGKTLANAVVVSSGLDSQAMLGSLSEEQIKKLEDVMRNPLKYGIPRYLLNRRMDPATGEDTHLVSSQLRFTVKSDIDSMRKIRCYKGIRHELGLPVRGQRTRTSFRGGRAVGVSKKKEMRKAARREAPKSTGTKAAPTKVAPAKLAPSKEAPAKGKK